MQLPVTSVDWLTNLESSIDAKFSEHFVNASNGINEAHCSLLQEEYTNFRNTYIGETYLADYSFDVELVDKIISSLKKGKAAGLDGLTAEHLQFCHPVLPLILVKLFNILMSFGYIPVCFDQSYTVPIPIDGKAIGRSLNVDDYRGISISSVLSKILEYCILDRYKRLFFTSDNQFGFKKDLSCSQVNYFVRCIVIVHVLLLKLVERWFSLASTCVKWGGHVTHFFTVIAGVRQGGALSSCLFAIYVDDIVKRIYKSGLDCNISFLCTKAFLYADNILLLSPSVHAFQAMLLICDQELLFVSTTTNQYVSVQGHV